MSKHNAAHRSAIANISNPVIREAVEAQVEAIESEETNEVELDETIDTDTDFATFEAKSLAMRQKAIDAWETRTLVSLAKRRAKFVTTRDERHERRMAEWALKNNNPTSLTGQSREGLEKFLEASVAKELARVEELTKQLEKLRAMAAEAIAS